MSDAFDSGSADFTGISVDPEPRLYIRHVLHKAFISVDEMGTEAAASTGVILDIVSVPFVVEIDRPFIYIIRDGQTGTILFIGRVLDPRSP